MLPAKTQRKQVDYWKAQAQRDWKTAEYLFRGKRYDSCLFFCHLALEKYLKGLVVLQTKTSAPYIHDLAKLAGLGMLDVSKERLMQLRAFTTFNIAGRYDDEKFAFHKIATRTFTVQHLQECKELLQWLKQNYQKK